RRDLAQHARPDVRALVTVVLVAVAGLLRAPAADGGAPAHERHLLALVIGVQGQAGETLPRRIAPLVLVVEPRIVPDVPAIDDDRELHVRRVVLGPGWQLDRSPEALERRGV